ncbi:MAG: methylated-DNA--[protein]-cysteine S-methyltransferase [Actinomycetota bacterium]
MRELERELRRGTSERGDALEASRRFLESAERAGLVEVAYSVVGSPLGDLLLASTERGLVRVSFFFGESLDDVLEELARHVSTRVLEVSARLDQARRELDEYFDRRRRTFQVGVDLRLIRSDFRKRVLEVARAIPYGDVATYRQVATGAGNPAAVRAAGSALGANPVPIVVPCHRVLRTDGSMGGYGGGLDRKLRLLKLEGAA